jgi:HD domain
MPCEPNVVAAPEVAGDAACESEEACIHLAEELAREFGAPAGVLDTQAGSWCASVGAPVWQFPSIDGGLLAKIHSDELRASRALAWRRAEDKDTTWLILAAPDSLGRQRVALLGFRAAGPIAREGEIGANGRTAETWTSGGAPSAWGPACPERALAAWGREVAKQLWDAHTSRSRPEPWSGSTKPDEESERQVIGRLIRRLRISDPPQHFQSMATTVLRTSLNMEAVAWVPKDSHQPVVVSGTVAGLTSQAYRVFPSPAGRESTFISRDCGTPSVQGAPPGVRRYASVAAGSLGWLLAVNPLDNRSISTADIERLQYVASLIATQLSNGKIYADLKELLFGIIRALAAAIDAKDPYTSGHSERVARIAVRLAEELGMPPAKRSDLYLAGLLHDVGKIGIDDVVLKKTGPLTPEEYRKIQLHVEIGVTILKDLKKLSHILPGVRHHHESMDGTGYPDHLSGEDIPMEARILAVADAFDAMSSNRPYRKQLSPTQIDRVFQEGRNVQWDSQVIDALFACRGDLEAIRQKGLGDSLVGAVDVTLGRT